MQSSVADSVLTYVLHLAGPVAGMLPMLDVIGVYVLVSLAVIDTHPVSPPSAIA
jgi:hypothetical protein